MRLNKINENKSIFSSDNNKMTLKISIVLQVEQL